MRDIRVLADPVTLRPIDFAQGRRAQGDLSSFPSVVMLSADEA